METQRELFSDLETAADSGVSTPGRAVSRIIVKGLFGNFDYSLPDELSTADLSKVFILYGDNGSGKTTILKTLFHLLSPANNRGHRNALAGLPFQSFEVHLTGGAWICVTRNSESTYAITGKLEERELQVRFDAASENKFGSNEQQDAFLGFLREINQTVYFLSADRTIMSDALPRSDDRLELMMLQGRLKGPLEATQAAEIVQRNGPVEQVLLFANDWIRRQVIRASARGNENTNTVYADIVRRIAGSPSSELPSDHDSRRLSELLTGLAASNEKYAKYKFTTPLQVSEIIEALNSADKQTAALLVNVLKPYVDGIKARLDALEKLQRTTASFVENLNSFYKHKTITFDVSEGIVIRQDDGSSMDPSLLSSGERQLLLMFCHLVLPRRGQGVFLIDEPELSLNVKWQRRLIHELRELVSGADVQLVFASHSIEFLSEHLDKVVELRSSDHPRGTVKLAGATSDAANNS